MPQLSVMVPQFAVPQVWAVVAEVQPHRPDVAPPPQVCPVPEQVAGHCTVWPQLLTVGPQWPPAQVVDEDSSVQVAQSLLSALHCLGSQGVFTCAGQLPLPSQTDFSNRSPEEQLWSAQTVVLSKVQAALFDGAQTPAHLLPEAPQDVRGAEE